ncbi:hypothetical protein AM493_02535 [Flavobacterium akiainvivens]|uniref:Uncharacterized protein n=1 Tax=Flavobacterium akiainvivens TaxID=1202724 RepID=A0A0M8M910_9FLAO|nr:hypothetical protein [Flavobacterium akiainvivens]KOS05035.1 hypothetical protein AM493_02535 [Flavobacterium akiainvivens]SFQ39910.1 hypothetical protein SAMN05444144_10410 [Flavobacterium akiainvivens]
MLLQTHNFDEVIETLINNAQSFSFNLKDLPDAFEYTANLNPNHKSIRSHQTFKPIFDELDAKKNSCLYWFELDDDINCKTLIDLLNTSRLSLAEKERIVPVANKNCDSNVLYVGIRRRGYTQKWKLSNISGRMIQHLGYYAKGSTQGLQLAYWAAEAGLDIKLNVVQFEEDFPNAYLEAFEKIMAYKLKPLCGKH